MAKNVIAVVHFPKTRLPETMISSMPKCYQTDLVIQERYRMLSCFRWYSREQALSVATSSQDAVMVDI